MNPLDSIISQLKVNLEEYTMLKKTDYHLKELQLQLENIYQKRESLFNILKKEEHDVESLENRSVKKLFYKVLGNEEHQLEKERQEYLKASLEYNNCQDEVELLEYEKNLLRDKVKKLPQLVEQIGRLKRLREKEVLSYSNDSALKTALSKNLILTDAIIGERKEHLEALDIGKSCLQEVRLISNHLIKAQNWGQWQNQQSSSRMKYHAIDGARRHLPKAQMILNQFRKELLDVGVDDPRLKIALEESGGFSILFFDNIIADWIVSQKLSKSIASIKSTLNVIDSALIHIDTKLVELDQKYNDFILQKDEILLQE